MAVITIGTPFNIDLEFKIAGFDKRLVAWLIDMFVICLYYYLMLRFIYPLFGLGSGIATGAALFALYIPVLLYQLLFELLMDGQTLGKKVAGIAVIDIAGGEPTWGQYLIRWILCLGNLSMYIIPYVLLIQPVALLGLLILYLPDFLSVMISARSQRLGDFAAGTAVIDRHYKSNIGETIYLPVEHSTYQPLFPQVMRLTDRDINGIRNLVNTRNPGKNTEAYMEQVANRIKTVLQIETDMYYPAFLEQLLFDYNYYSTRK